MHVKLLIFDEQEMFRNGLCKMLSQLPWISHIQETGDMDEAFSIMKCCFPHILLFNPNNNNMYIDLIPKMKDLCPQIKIALLTELADIDSMMAAAKYGAHGYFLKHTPFKEFESNLFDIANGRYRITTSLGSLLYEGISKSLQAKDLTKREIAIFELVSKGYSNKEIASDLNISTNTVKNHISSIMQKCNFSTRYQMIVNQRNKAN